mgnify:FL=1|tara:strand:+ start:31986 stop:33368 length:1383 start_codon:yes stop_codon:yes gene_type:complete
MNIKAENKDKKLEFNFSQEYLNKIVNNIKNQNIDYINKELNKLHPSDSAEVISNLSEQIREVLFNFEYFDINPKIIVEFTDELQKEVLALLNPIKIKKIIQNLESDNAVHLVENLETAKCDEVLKLLDEKYKKFFIETLNLYHENSAGRIMQTEFASVPQQWSVGETIDYLRETKDLPNEFVLIFIVNENNNPVGSVSSSRVLTASREVKMKEIMIDNKFLIPADMDQEDVAYNFETYNLVSAGVVDNENKLIGMITADDIVTILKEETEEDTFRLAGVSEEDISDSAIDITKKRFIWLTLNLITAVIASLVIGFFDENIEKVVALAILMPIVASMGGNAATQTLTVTVRLLATKELISSNIKKIISKEFLVGFFNGIIFAFITAILILFWFNDKNLSILIGLAMIINMSVAGLFGILTPLTLDKFKIDPAIASSVFVTTITDVIGFLSFLGLASFVLGI